MFKIWLETCVNWLVENFSTWELVMLLIVLTCATIAFGIGIFHSI